MKTIKPCMVTCVAILLISCSPVNYFQVFKAVPAGNTLLHDNALVYEDDHCIVSYNFWKEGGDIGFRFQNKTDNDIYLDLDESFFILNGVAHKYFRNRVITTTPEKTVPRSRSLPAAGSATGTAHRDLLPGTRFEVSDFTSLIAGSGYTVSFTEEDLVTIPAKTSQTITEFSVTQILYRDCDLPRFPNSGKDIRTKRFTATNSPVIFSNRIVYYTGKSSLPVKFENEFYVSEITNYNYNQMVEYKNETLCGEKSTVRTMSYKYSSPDKFYIEYSKGAASSRY